MPNLRSATRATPRPASGFRVLGGWRVAAARAAAVLGRGDADLVQEEAREVALRREPELRGDLGNLAVARGQARERSLDAQHVEVGAGLVAGAQLEQGVEARARHADAGRHLGQVEGLVL